MALSSTCSAADANCRFDESTHGLCIEYRCDDV